MRKIYSYIIGFSLIALALTACHVEPVGPVEPDGEGILLKLETGDLSLATKAERPGDDDGPFNENILGTTVDIFFFPEEATDATVSVKNLSASVRAGGYVQIPVSTGDIYAIFGSTAAGSKAEIYVVANYNGATAIDHSRRYTLGEIKNMPLAKADWSVFPQAKFVMTGKTTLTLTNASSNTPASGVVQMKRIAAKISFRLTVADEIVVENTTRDHEGQIVDKTLDTWRPLKNSMTVYLQYGMNYALLSGDPQLVPAVAKGSGATDSLYTYKENILKETTEKKVRTRTIIDRPPYKDPVTNEWVVETHIDNNVEVPLYTTLYTRHTAGPGNSDVATPTELSGPFYTYPVTWDPGVPTEPFLKLVIPWNNGSRTKYYYYKVPFTGTSIEANNWYEITLDVQVLGGEDELPVPLEAKYKVVDWVEGEEAEAFTVAARYLSVPKTEWIMYNTDELKIPITSSHDVQIVGYQVKNGGTGVNNAFAAADKYVNGQPRAAAWIGSNPSIYNPFTDTRFSINSSTTIGTVYATSVNYNQSGMNGAPYPSNTTTAAAWFPEIELTRDQIVIRHNLNNNMSTSGYDVAPYFIRFRVQHKDDPTNYYRDIIIEQRPAIMIDAEFNSGGTNSIGYVYVNNGSNDDLGGGGNSNSSGNNTNDYMYIISTSVLPTTGNLSNYVLGDPRSLTGNNLNTVNNNTWNNWSSAARYVGRTGNQTRRLSSNYYPAIMDESGDNIIAPKIRIASSHGRTDDVSYANAIRRCASYQEDGYPAGRWRVPTKAEIMFMAQLNTDKKIPRLLGNNTNNTTTDYWCNSGYVTVYNGNSTQDPDYSSGKNGSKYVRCVYDEWFWENTEHEKVTKDEFTWGDQKREDVIRTKAK